MRDILPQVPDSILPLLTKNDRLDMIDYFENNMKAVAKNRFEESCELKTLTPNYMVLQTSKHSSIELLLINDSTLCLVRTYEGPTSDSYAAIYNTQWQLIQQLEKPSVENFLQAETDEESRMLLHALPLISATISAENKTITWQLQTSELPSKNPFKNKELIIKHTLVP